MSDLVYVHTPEVLGVEPESSKRLLRFLAAWDKLDTDEQRRFVAHIAEHRIINRERDTLPTIAVAKMLKTSFYRVKGMVTSGVLHPVETKHASDGAVYYKFDRREIEALMQSKPDFI